MRHRSKVVQRNQASLKMLAAPLKVQEGVVEVHQEEGEVEVDQEKEVVEVHQEAENSYFEKVKKVTANLHDYCRKG